MARACVQEGAQNWNCDAIYLIHSYGKQTYMPSSGECLLYKWFGCLVAKPCLTLCNPMDCGPPGSSVHGILQARILEWGAISLPQGSKPCLLHWQVDSLPPSYQGSPYKHRFTLTCLHLSFLNDAHGNTSKSFSFLWFNFFGCIPQAVCGIFVPQPGIKPMPPAVEVWSPNYWTAREVSLTQFLNAAYYSTL